MKVKTGIGAFLILLGSLFFIASPAANAGECSEDDPCLTYAMMQGNDVINIIVCQTSVCGGGTFMGMRVVPQVAANKVTHDTTGTGGFMSDSNYNVSYNEKNGDFTLGNKNKSEESPEVKQKVVVNQENNTETTITTTTSRSANRVFSYQDTENNPNAVINTREVFPEGTSATISVEESNKSTNNKVSAVKTFGSQVTKEDAIDQITLDLEQSFADLLKLWSVDWSLMLFNWFLI